MGLINRDGIWKKKMAGLSRHLHEVVGDGQEPGFDLHFHFTSQVESLEVFVVLDLCKDRFYIAASPLSVPDAFFAF